TVGAFGLRTRVWRYKNGNMKTSKDRIAYDHPSLMNEALARDLIMGYSKKGDTVLDCFAGSGTTLKMALLLQRLWIGIEAHKPYVELAMNRISHTLNKVLAH